MHLEIPDPKKLSLEIFLMDLFLLTGSIFSNPCAFAILFASSKPPWTLMAQPFVKILSSSLNFSPPARTVTAERKTPRFRNKNTEDAPNIALLQSPLRRDFPGSDQVRKIVGKMMADPDYLLLTWAII